MAHDKLTYHHVRIDMMGGIAYKARLSREDVDFLATAHIRGDKRAFVIPTNTGASLRIMLGMIVGIEDKECTHEHCQP